MRLGFDIDEVVCDLISYLCNYLTENYRVSWEPGCWTTYSLIDCDYSGCNDKKFNNRVAIDLWNRVFDLNFLMGCDAVKGAVKSLQLLKRHGHALHYITTREKDKEYLTIKWLQSKGIPFDSVHHVGSIGEKGALGKSLNLDFFVDDLEKNLSSMLSHKKRWKKGLVLLDKPWNSNYYDDNKFIKLENWEQIIRHLGINNR